MTAPPQSEEAEMGVLGAMLENRQSIERALDVLEPNGEQKFYKPSHGRVYAAIRGLWANSKPVDAVLVGDLLGQDMIPALSSMLYMAAVPAHVTAQAGLVRQAWVRREAIASLTRALHEAEHGDPIAAVNAGLADVDRLVGGKESDSLESIGDLFHDLIGEMQADKPREVFHPPIRCLPKLVPGRVYVLGGYTGQGKTSLATQWAGHLAGNGIPVTYHSLEMSKEDIRNRVAVQLGVPLAQLEAQGEKRFWDRLLAAGSTVSGWPLKVADSSSVVCADVLRVQRQAKARVIFVDHIHQMEVKQDRDGHRVALNRELRQFVSLAKSENVAVVLLAQLRRREMEGKTQYPRPTLRDLKETGALEENAAYVGFVWRKIDDDGVMLPYAEWIVGKDRFGAIPAPSVMEFDGSRLLFKAG